MNLPLAGIKVIEFGRVFSAPFCSMMLSDLGAEIIKIEKPKTGDESRSFGPPYVNDLSCYFISLNRNKKSITLNLNSDEGKLILTKLLKNADVFIHNTLPNTIDKLGFSYEHVKTFNPKLIYCGINGLGYNSSFCNEPAQDIIAQSLSGIMSITGFDTNPPTRAGLPITDSFAGVLAAYAIIAALYQRNNTNEGQLVSTSLLEAAMALTSYVSASFLSNKIIPGKTGNSHCSIVPYNAYKTIDNWISIAISNQSMWVRFCRALDFNELLHTDKFSSNKNRVENRIELDDLLQNRFAKLRSLEIIKILKTNKVICAMINDFSEVFQSAEVNELHMQLSAFHPRIGKIEYIGSPINFSTFETQNNMPPPLLGEHNVEILSNLGYSDNDINQFIDNGII